MIQSNPDTIERVRAVTKMSLAELQTEYMRHFSRETKSRNRKELVAKIAKRIQEDDDFKMNQAKAAPSITAKFERKGRSKNKTKTAKREKAAVDKKPRTKVKPVGGRDPRLPKVGTTIEREYKGMKLHVTVESDGFTYGGKSYRSLSAVAAQITGAEAINGYLFFQLGDYAKKEKTGK